MTHAEAIARAIRTVDFDKALKFATDIANDQEALRVARDISARALRGEIDLREAHRMIVQAARG